MLGNEASAATVKSLIAAISATDTAGATGAWVDVHGAVGELMVITSLGDITGSCTLEVDTCTDGAGAGLATLTANEGAFAAGADNQVQKRTYDANASLGWIRIKGVIVTGPAPIAAIVAYRPKTTA